MYAEEQLLKRWKPKLAIYTNARKKDETIWKLNLENYQNIPIEDVAKFVLLCGNYYWFELKIETYNSTFIVKNKLFCYF